MNPTVCAKSSFRISMGCILLPNVVLCGGPAPTIELARRWRPVRSSYGLALSLLARSWQMTAQSLGVIVTGTKTVVPVMFIAALTPPFGLSRSLTTGHLFFASSADTILDGSPRDSILNGKRQGSGQTSVTTRVWSALERTIKGVVNACLG